MQNFRDSVIIIIFAGKTKKREKDSFIYNMCVHGSYWHGADYAGQDYSDNRI